MGQAATSVMRPRDRLPEHPLQQANARALRIFGGTSEVMLEIIGRSFT